MKKIISTIIILTMLFSSMSLSVNALVLGDWEVEISNGEAYLTGYNGIWSGKTELPTQVDGFTVRGIRGLQFGENVTEIIIPEGYKSLTEKGENSVYHPDRYRVFGLIKGKLCKISLPQSLEVLDVSFEGCTELQEISIPAKVKKLSSIDCGDGLNHDNIGMFENCKNLKNVFLQEGLEVIEANAFRNCTSLCDFKIPNTVTEIQFNTFENCDSLVNMVIPDSVINYGNVTTGIWSDVKLPPARQVFSGCDNLETVVIGDGVRQLYSTMTFGASYGELANCPKLKNVYLGNSITILSGSESFMGTLSEITYKFCGALGNSESLETIIVPNSVQEIGQLFLGGSNNIKCVVLPKNITRIGAINKKYKDYAFKNVDGKPLPKLFIYGYAGTMAESYANTEGIPFIDISVATPTNSKVIIDGQEVNFTAYNIGGNNYFKLRDIASAINGTSKNFNVS